MENTFETYYRFCDKLKSLQKNGIFDGRRQITLNENYQDISWLRNFVIDGLNIKLKKFTTGGTEGEGSALELEHFSLVELLDMFYYDKRVLLADLKNLKQKCQTQTQSKNLNDLINLVTQSVEKVTIKSDADHIKTSLVFPLSNGEVEPEIEKLLQLRLYAFEEATQKEYFPTSNPGSKTGFDFCSRDILFEYFMPENFYKLNTEGIAKLLQAVSNNYLADYGVSPCAVELAPLGLGNKVTFGEYLPNRGKILINSDLLKTIDQMKSAAGGTGNKSFPLKLLSTVVHEARHRVQFSMYNKTDFDKTQSKEQIVVSSLKEPNNYSSFAHYLASAAEIDARDAAQQYIYDLAKAFEKDGNKTNSNVLKSFYNYTKHRELNNNKAEINSRYKPYFAHIYTKDMFQNVPSLANDYSTMFDSFISYDRAL